MFRLCWALRCFSTKFPAQIALEKSVFLYKFNQAQSINHFYNEIMLPQTSLAQKIFGLKLIIENRSPLTFAPKLKININFFIRKICTQSSNFDSISIVEFFSLAMEIDKRSDEWFHFKFAMNNWKTLKLKIIENINANLYQKKDYISLFRSWAYFKTKVFEVENHCRKIIYDKSTILDLEDCMMLLEGLIDLKLQNYLDLSQVILKRVNQLKEIDSKTSARVLEIISYFAKYPSFQTETQQYLSNLSNLIPNWKKEELLSVIKFYNKGEWDDLIPLEIATQSLLSLTRYDQFNMTFLLDLYKELIENGKYSSVLSKLIEKVKTDIVAKIGTDIIDSRLLLKLLKLLDGINEEIAVSLKKQIENCKWLYFGHKFDVINSISHIFFTKSGKSIPLTNIISIDTLLNEDIVYLTRKYIDIKLEILSAILQTREDLQVNLEKWKNAILNELDDIGESDDKTRKFIKDISEVTIPENIFPYLRPIYLKILDFCDRDMNKTESAFILKDSLKLCRSDPIAWEAFYKKNSYIFQFHHIENALKIKGIPEFIKKLLYSKLSQKTIK